MKQHPSGSEFLSVLKEETQALHSALEQTQVSQQLMSPTLSRDTYLALLYAFYGAFAPLENALEKALKRHNGSIAFHPRVPLAIEDIRYISGHSTDIPPVAPSSSQEPDLPSLPAALGVLYVLEGSRLGGKVISHQLGKTIGVTPIEGGRFFAGTGSGGLESWKAFRTYCEGYVKEHPEAAGEIIRSANATFHFIREHFMRAAALQEQA